MKISAADINAGIAAANVFVPQLASLITVGTFAIQQLFAIWAPKNPGKTFEEFLTELVQDATDVKELAAEQLIARGFVWDAAQQTWTKPVVEPQG